MPHVVWRGSIQFGLVSIPAGLYSAEQPQELHFTLLDKRDHAPVGYTRVNKVTGEKVGWEQIVRGFQYGGDRVVILTEEDFKSAAATAADDTLEILEFVDGAAIAPAAYERPYFVAPLPEGEKAYALLRETLRHTGRTGIGRLALRTRQYVAALGVRGPAITLTLLRYADELREPTGLDLPGDVAAVGLTPTELDLAAQLVETMTRPWQPEEFRDTHRDALRALIERKASAGETTTVPRTEERRPTAAPTPPAELVEILRQSLSQAESESATSVGGAANVDSEPQPPQQQEQPRGPERDDQQRQWQQQQQMQKAQARDRRTRS